MDIRLDHILAAQVLAITCLQPGRDKFGVFDILSWVRDEELNKAVGGSPTSDHKGGNAADFKPRNFNVEFVFKWYVKESGIKFRQIIFYPNQNFIHISSNHPEKPHKEEALICTEPGKYVPYKEYYEQ